MPNLTRIFVSPSPTPSQHSHSHAHLQAFSRSPSQPHTPDNDTDPPFPASQLASDPGNHTDTKAEVSLDGNADLEFESSSDEETRRQNRKSIPSSTWLRYTAEERGIVDGLDRLRDRDLGVHLFNAYALGRRGRWNQDGDEGKRRGSGKSAKAWKPPKSWTAWPLPASEIPRNGEFVGEGVDDGLDRFTIKKGQEGVSGELRDVLVGVMLKLAKEKWREREWDAEETSATQGSHGKALAEQDMVMSSVEAEEDEERIRNHTIKGAASGPAPEEDEKAPPSAFRSIISADDERSRFLLEPTITSILAKLDELLIALHHTRQSWGRRGKSLGASTVHSPRTTSMTRSSIEPPPTEEVASHRNPRGRPRKGTHPTGDCSRPRDSENNNLPDDSIVWRAKTTHRGRPRKQYPRHDNETEEEYIIRIARLQKKPIPIPKWMASRSPIAAPDKKRVHNGTRMRSPPKKVSTEEENQTVWRKKLGLRDWSEVLGMAGLVGFEKGALERTHRRCGEIFGEGMDWWVMDDANAQDEGLASVSELVGGDGYDGGEMEGGVHVDGFLKPIKSQKGWRGLDTKKRKRRWPGARDGGHHEDEDLEGTDRVGLGRLYSSPMDIDVHSDNGSRKPL